MSAFGIWAGPILVFLMVLWTSNSMSGQDRAQTPRSAIPVVVGECPCKVEVGCPQVCRGTATSVVRRGSDGKDGHDGKDGEEGRDGRDGQNGRDGRDGQNGKDGHDCKNARESTSDDVLSTLLKTAAALIAFAAWIVLRIMDWGNQRQAARSDYMSHLNKITEMISDKPPLSGIYARSPFYEEGLVARYGESGIPEDKKEVLVKQRWFIYHHFSVFEIIYNDYHHLWLKLPRDREAWDANDAWIREFFLRVPDAHELLQHAQTQYCAPFVRYALNLPHA